MGQKFYARREPQFTWPNGAVGYGSGGPMDCLGPYAKVKNCPVVIAGREVARHTCYATGYADSAFSVPACTQHRGKHVRGYFTVDNGNVEFRVMDSHKHLFISEN